MASEPARPTTARNGLGQNKEVLFHSQKAPLWLRLILLLFMIGFGYAALLLLGGATGLVQLRGTKPVQPPSLLVFFVIAILFCLGSWGLWFWELWILYDSSRDTLIYRHKGILRTLQKEYPAKNISSVRLKYVRSLGSRHYYMTLILNNGESRWLATLRGHPESAKVVAASIAGRIGKHFDILGER